MTFAKLHDQWLTLATKPAPVAKPEISPPVASRPLDEITAEVKTLEAELEKDINEIKEHFE
jgi:hypothetical protein